METSRCLQMETSRCSQMETSTSVDGMKYKTQDQDLKVNLIKTTSGRRGGRGLRYGGPTLYMYIICLCSDVFKRVFMVWAA